MIAKQEILAALEQLPDSATLEEAFAALDRLAEQEFEASIQRGLDDVAAGRTYPLEEVFRDLGVDT